MNLYGQNRSKTREYIFIDHSYEKITLKKDSFNYVHSVGLQYKEIDGTIKYKDDTLILNSEYQTDNYKLENNDNPKLKKHEIEIIVIDSIFHNQIELFATNKFKRKQKTLIQPKNENYDSISLKKYIINKRKYVRKHGVDLIFWGTNFHINLNFKNIPSNSITMAFSEYPGMNYTFFKNVEAIETEKGLIFLDENNDLTRPSYSLKNRDKHKRKNRNLKIYEKE